MDRRSFLQSFAALPAFSRLLSARNSKSDHKSLAITMDDPNVKESPVFSPQDRTRRILETLDHSKIKATLFVCGKRVDQVEGRAILQEWNLAGHSLGNHTYSHSNYNDPAQTLEVFSSDILRGENVVKDYSGFTKLMRFPYLKEGNTLAKRDEIRGFLASHSYRIGYVTIDTSDWYVDSRLEAKLRNDPKTSLMPYRDFYLRHLLNRAAFYDNLAFDLTGRRVKHTMLLHNTLTNALFLGDVLQEFRDHGWKLLDSSEAYMDPVFAQEPDIMPAGESLVWAMAKATGLYDKILRYPGENDVYEKPEMDRLGL